VRSLAIIGIAAAVFVLFLVRNERSAQEVVRAEDAALGRLRALAAAPPGPPRIEGGYRFEWALGGDLPPVLLALPETTGVCLFAAAPGGAVYACDLFGAPAPDVTPLRIHAARAAENPPLPPGWRPIP
jgi:hypothetical protein